MKYLIEMDSNINLLNLFCMLRQTNKIFIILSYHMLLLYSTTTYIIKEKHGTASVGVAPLSNSDVLIIIIMVIFKCYFSGELIALS